MVGGRAKKCGKSTHDPSALHTSQFAFSYFQTIKRGCALWVVEHNSTMLNSFVCSVANFTRLNYLRIEHTHSPQPHPTQYTRTHNGDGRWVPCFVFRFVDPFIVLLLQFIYLNNYSFPESGARKNMADKLRNKKAGGEFENARVKNREISAFEFIKLIYSWGTKCVRHTQHSPHRPTQHLIREWIMSSSCMIPFQRTDFNLFSLLLFMVGLTLPA